MARRVRNLISGCGLVLGLLAWSGWPGITIARDPGQELKIEGDLKAIQGQWISRDGQGMESVWNFKAEHVSLKTPTRAYEMSIKLNPKGEPEKHIDFDVSTDSPNAKGYKTQGIYKFAADRTLKICFSDCDSGRPREFKTDFGKSFSFDLKRKK